MAYPLKIYDTPQGRKSEINTGSTTVVIESCIKFGTKVIITSSILLVLIKKTKKVCVMETKYESTISHIYII